MSQECYLEFMSARTSDKTWTTHDVPDCLISSVRSLTTIGRIDPIRYFGIGKCLDRLRENLFVDSSGRKLAVKV